MLQPSRGRAPLPTSKTVRPCFSLASHLLQQVHVGAPTLPGRASHADLAGAAAGVTAIMFVRLNLGSFLGCCRGGKFGIHEAAISGEGTATDAGRDEDFAAALARNCLKLYGESHFYGRANRMQRDRCFRMIDLEFGEQLV